MSREYARAPANHHLQAFLPFGPNAVQSAVQNRAFPFQLPCSVLVPRPAAISEWAGSSAGPPPPAELLWCRLWRVFSNHSPGVEDWRSGRIWPRIRILIPWGYSHWGSLHFVLSLWWKQKEVTDNLKFTSGTLLNSLSKESIVALFVINSFMKVSFLLVFLSHNTLHDN